MTAPTGLLLTKRSQQVRQPGDLCFPGGGIETASDGLLSRLLTLPGMPLHKWPDWRRLQRRQPDTARFINQLLATGLRESFEEIGLLPPAVEFLGALPPQQLIMFKRIIFPMAGEITWQRRFRTNWEVERLVFIPFESLLDPRRYACLHLTYDDHLRRRYGARDATHPCFIHQPQGQAREVLWGATYRIAMVLLTAVFGFKPPPKAELPVVERVLTSEYLTGRVSDKTA